MACAAGVGVGDGHRLLTLVRHSEQVRGDVAVEIAADLSKAGAAVRGLDVVAINALGAHVEAGLGYLMLIELDTRMAGEAQAVVGDARELVTVRTWRMEIMAGGAGQELRAVPVLARLNEVGVLLVMRL